MPHKEQGDFWTEGVTAYLRGLALAHCPYFRGQQGYIAWKDGWHTAYNADVENAVELDDYAIIPTAPRGRHPTD